MTEDELRVSVRGLGWTLSKRKIGHRFFFYAAKRCGRKVRRRYLFAEASLVGKTQADVWEKLL